MTAIAAGLLIPLATNCHASPVDDAFARTFLERLRVGDSAGFSQLEPGPLRAQGWQRVAAIRKFLPQDALDSVRLISWASTRDTENGARRKLVYYLYSPREYSQAEIWIVRKGDTSYVNSVRTAGPRPLDRPGP